MGLLDFQTAQMQEENIQVARLSHQYNIAHIKPKLPLHSGILRKNVNGYCSWLAT